MDIRPIETVFRGHKFRSRLEARWAVFFTELGLTYEYELEGFELGNGIRYLPDFFIPSLNAHVEVKPNRELTRKELEKLILFSADGDKPLILIVGTPTNETMYLMDRHTVEGWYAYVAGSDEETHEEQLSALFEQLEDYSKVEFGSAPFINGIQLIFTHRNPWMEHHVKGALLKAKQARFEHGAKG